MLKVRAIDDRNLDPRALAWLARLRRLAGEQVLKSGDRDQAAERFRASLRIRERLNNEPLPPVLAFEFAMIHASIFGLERRGGDTGEKAKTEALRAIEFIDQSEESSSDLKERSARLKQWIESQGDVK
jgi:hypothetical protein